MIAAVGLVFTTKSEVKGSIGYLNCDGNNVTIVNSLVEWIARIFLCIDFSSVGDLLTPTKRSASCNNR